MQGKTLNSQNYRKNLPLLLHFSFPYFLLYHVSGVGHLKEVVISFCEKMARPCH